MSSERPHARRARAQHVPNIERSIAAAAVVKDGEMFLLTDRHGDVPAARGHGYGLYYHDCRFLSAYALSVGGEALIPLSVANRGGYMAVFRLTNRDMRLVGHGELAKQTVGVEWTRLLRHEARGLHDVLAFHNYGGTTLTLPVRLDLAVDFDDIFEVRSLAREPRGKLHAPRWQRGALEFRYDGLDGVTRTTRVGFNLPVKHAEDGVCFELELAPQARVEVCVEVEVSEHEEHVREAPAEAGASVAVLDSRMREASRAWMAGHTAVRSNSILLDRVLGASFSDLHALRTPFDDRHYFAAGIPWYATLFGRDSLVTAFQMLAYAPDIARETLCLLAELQGTQDDPWREEQPGKILHEYRQGELANLNRVPFGRYYGSVDATPLFLILLVEHARWTGGLDLFQQLCPHVERALAWLDRACADTGYLAYDAQSTGGLLNQGWKDSDDAVQHADGTVATGPIALVEVQGYVYQAKQGLADLFERSGDAARAAALRHEAEQLHRRFDRDFWLPEADYYAMALAGGEPAGAIASNPGHALWSGIVSARKAAKVAARLTADDMFTGWGIRTLSSASPRYNPLGYHVGTVWPHDNAIILAGLRRYGLDVAAMRVFMGMFDAASHFWQARLPELFSGFQREDDEQPVSYPVACHPQAWAAGTLPFMLTTLLGLQADGFAGVLRVERPLLPPFVDRLELDDLRVGRGHVSLRFERTSGGDVGVAVVRAMGVSVEVAPARHPHR